MTLTSADIAVITDICAKLVRESVANSSRGDGGLSLPVPTQRPGTVGATANPGESVLVRVDGDASPISAVNTLVAPLRGGERVMVTFVPPSGIYVTGTFDGIIAAPVADFITTDESHAASVTNYFDLATVGPSVSLRCGTAAAVIVMAKVKTTGQDYVYLSYDRTGSDGSTHAANDNDGFLGASPFGNSYLSRVGGGLATGLDPDVIYTFTMKYKHTSNTGNYQDRLIMVWPYAQQL